MRTLKSMGMITMLLAAILLVSAGSAFADRGGHGRNDGHDRRGRIEYRGDHKKAHAPKRHYAKRYDHRRYGHAYGKSYWAGKRHHRGYWAKPHYTPWRRPHNPWWR